MISPGFGLDVELAKGVVRPLCVVCDAAGRCGALGKYFEVDAITGAEIDGAARLPSSGFLEALFLDASELNIRLTSRV